MTSWDKEGRQWLGLMDELIRQRGEPCKNFLLVEHSVNYTLLLGEWKCWVKGRMLKMCPGPGPVKDGHPWWRCIEWFEAEAMTQALGYFEKNHPSFFFFFCFVFPEKHFERVRERLRYLLDDHQRQQGMVAAHARWLLEKCKNPTIS